MTNDSDHKQYTSWWCDDVTGRSSGSRMPVATKYASQTMRTAGRHIPPFTGIRNVSQAQIWLSQPMGMSARHILRSQTMATAGRRIFPFGAKKDVLFSCLSSHTAELKCITDWRLKSVRTSTSKFSVLASPAQPRNDERIYHRQKSHDHD